MDFTHPLPPKLEGDIGNFLSAGGEVGQYSSLFTLNASEKHSCASEKHLNEANNSLKIQATDAILDFLEYKEVINFTKLFVFQNPLHS